MSCKGKYDTVGIKDDMIMWRRLYIGSCVSYTSLKGRQSGMNIQCDDVVEERNPDIIVVSKKETKCIIVDIAIPGDSRVYEKEFQKIENYQDLKWEIRRMWSVRNVDVVPVVVGALGSVTKNLGKWTEKLGISICNSGAKRAPITRARGGLSNTPKLSPMDEGHEQPDSPEVSSRETW